MANCMDYIIAETSKSAAITDAAWLAKIEVKKQNGWLRKTEKAK